MNVIIGEQKFERVGPCLFVGCVTNEAAVPMLHTHIEGLCEHTARALLEALRSRIESTDWEGERAKWAHSTTTTE